MNEVVLLNPNINIVKEEKEHFSILDHLGLGLVGSSLQKWGGYSVKIIDGYALNIHKDDLIRMALAEHPDYIGITCNYIGFPDAVEIADRLKKEREDLFIFIGGEHCTYSAEEILTNYTFIDAVVRGEGEQTTVEMLKNIDKLSEVEGIYYRDPGSGDIVKNQPREGIADLDSIPFSMRDNLDYCEKNNQMTIIGMLTQRGCNFDCDFCNAHRFFRLGGGKVIRQRSVGNVADEIEYLYHRYYGSGIVEKMYFYDANFINGSRQSKQWALELAREIIRRKTIIPFEIYLRGDSLDPASDQQLIDVLKEAGLDSVFVGIESFDNDDLKAFQKNISAQRCYETVKFLIENNIFGLTQGVIMFNPYSTFKSARNTARILKEFNLASFWNLSQKIQLFPGVRLIDKIRDDGLLHESISKDKSAVYSYVFQHKKVGRLSDYLIELNNNDIVINDNSIPRHIQGSIKRFCYNLQNMPGPLKTLDTAAANVKTRVEKINELNFEYFMDISVAFERAETMAAIEKRTAEYLRQSDELVSALDHYYQTVLEQLDLELNAIEEKLA